MSGEVSGTGSRPQLPGEVKLVPAWLRPHRGEQRRSVLAVVLIANRVAGRVAGQVSAAAAYGCAVDRGRAVPRSGDTQSRSAQQRPADAAPPVASVRERPCGNQRHFDGSAGARDCCRVKVSAVKLLASGAGIWLANARFCLVVLGVRSRWSRRPRGGSPGQDAQDAARFEAMFTAAREEDWAEFTADCGKYTVECSCRRS